MTINATEYKKPLPVPDEASKPFFEGARQHKLMIQKCLDCRAVMWPVKPRCDNCWSANITWSQASGKATLYSYTLMHQIYHPGFAEEAPYNICQIDLEEGLRMFTNVIGCDNSELKIGMPLEVTFEDLTDEISLPKFKPAQ